MNAYIHKVQYYETDKMGFVHHSNYIRWFEEARSDFFEQVGAPYSKTEEKGFLSPVLSMNCRYKKPSLYGENVRIEIVLEEFGNVKFRVSYKVLGCENNELKAEGESEHCFINKSGRPVSLKREWPELFQHLSGIIGSKNY